MTSPNPRLRLNLTVTPRVRERLDRLVAESDAETLTEVVRRALVLYENALRLKREGGSLIFETKDGKQRTVVIE